MLATRTEGAKTWEATEPPARLPRPEDGTRKTATTLQGEASSATRVTGQEGDTQQTGEIKIFSIQEVKCPTHTSRARSNPGKAQKSLEFP